MGTASIVLLAAVIAGGIGFDLGRRQGYADRDAETSREHWTYTDVLVNAVYSPTNFEVQPARMQAFQVISCTPLDWKERQKMKHLHMVPSKDGRCKDVVKEGYFEFYRRPDGARMIFPKEIAYGP